MKWPLGRNQAVKLMLQKYEKQTERTKESVIAERVKPVFNAVRQRFITAATEKK